MDIVSTFTYTPFSSMGFKLEPVADECTCALCGKHATECITSCCNLKCHQWCLDQCVEYLFKCPLCKKRYSDFNIKVRVDCDTYLSAVKKASFFNRLYRRIQNKHYCVALVSVNGDMNAETESQVYKHYVDLINML